MILRGISTPVQGDDAANKEYVDGHSFVTKYSPKSSSGNRFQGQLLMICNNSFQISFAFIYSYKAHETKPSYVDTVTFLIPASDVNISSDEINVLTAYNLSEIANGVSINSSVPKGPNGLTIRFTGGRNDSWGENYNGVLFVTISGKQQT